MQLMNEKTEESGLSIDRTALALGLHEFSLLSRIQAGQIKSVRTNSGEMLIPMWELERLAPEATNTVVADLENGEVPVSDAELGIKKAFGGLRQNGECRVRFTVPGYGDRFSTSEIESYCAAFATIARELTFAARLHEQLKDTSGLFDFGEAEVLSPHIGRWEVRAKLLDLGKSDILLGQREYGEFAVLERFRPESLYAKHNGIAEILLQGDDPVQLNREFTANAQHTLEFMASNLVAKAQKVVWEQFPDHRPGHVVAAISGRCRRAVANEETISQEQRQTNARGVRI